MMQGQHFGNKYWFEASVPDEVRTSCRDIFLANEALIPSWVNEVRIYWDAEGDRTDEGHALAAAYMEASYSYRYAAITICPPFLSEDEVDRASRIKHELCHIVSFPLVLYVKHIADILSNDDDMAAQIIKKELSEKTESMTEDLAQIILNFETSLIKQNNKK